MARRSAPAASAAIRLLTCARISFTERRRWHEVPAASAAFPSAPHRVGDSARSVAPCSAKTISMTAMKGGAAARAALLPRVLPRSAITASPAASSGCDSRQVGRIHVCNRSPKEKNIGAAQNVALAGPLRSSLSPRRREVGVRHRPKDYSERQVRPSCCAARLQAPHL